MDSQVNELTNGIIELCIKRLPHNQTVSFDGHIVITVDSYQLLFLEIKHTHQKDTANSSSSRNSHVPPKKKLLHGRQKFYARCESSEDEHERQKLASSVSGEEQSDLEKKESAAEDVKSHKKFKGDEKAKRHWKKGRKKAFTEEEAFRLREANNIEKLSAADGRSAVGGSKDKDTITKAVNSDKKSKKASREKNKKIHMCSLCSFTTTYKHCLLRHNQRKHKESSTTLPAAPSVPQMCSVCGKTFKSKDSLRIHTSLKHGPLGKRYPCNICNKAFYMKVHFEGHMNKHKNERPYTCAICGKGFLYVQNVKRHERTCGMNNRTKAVNDVPIECQACGITFKTRDYYRDHMAAKHSQTPKYECPVCLKLFRIRGSYYRHKMTCMKRQGLEPGEVHPDVMKNMLNQEKANALCSNEQHNQQSEENQQPVAQRQETLPQMAPQPKTNHQSLPNVHQLYHHYRRVHPNDLASSDHITDIPHREDYQHEQLQIQQYDILPQSQYMLNQPNIQTPSNQAGTLTNVSSQNNLESISKEEDALDNFQAGHSDLKSTSHGYHQVRFLNNLQSQRAYLQTMQAENTQGLMSHNSLVSHPELVSASEALHSLQSQPQSNDLENAQGQSQDRVHHDHEFQRPSLDQRMLLSSPKKSVSFASQVYDIQKQAHDLQRQSHDLQRQSHNLQRHLHTVQQHSPNMQRQSQNMSQPPSDLTSVDQMRPQSHEHQEQSHHGSHDLLLLSDTLQESQNELKQSHSQHQGPQDLSQSHLQLQPNSMQEHQPHLNPNVSGHQKPRNIQVDVQSSQGYSVPLELQSMHMLHSPGHGLEIQHGMHQMTSETSQQNLPSPNMDVQCIMSPYTWGKQVN